MTKDKTKLNRGWVKNAIIIFLAVMLVLTFFSNTIMNRSLPVVSAQYPNSGTISAKIRGTGTVSSNESYNVTVEETREVKTVAVKAGDTVTAGQVLFILADQESDELQSAKTELENLQYEYESYLLDISASDPSVQAAQQALAKAKKERDKAHTELTDANSSVKLAKAEVESAQKEYDTLKSQADAMKTRVNAAQKVFDAADLELAKATNALTQLETELTDEQEKLRQDLTEAENDLSNAKLELENATAEKEYIEGKLGMTYAEAEAAVEEASSKQTTLENSVYALKDALRTNIDSTRSVREAFGYIDSPVTSDIINGKGTEDGLIDILRKLEDTCWDVINSTSTSGAHFLSDANNLVISIQSKIKEVGLNNKADSQNDKFSGMSDEESTCYSNLSQLMDQVSQNLSDLDELNDGLFSVYEEIDEAQSVLNDRELAGAIREFDSCTENVKDLQQRVNEETIRYNNALPNDTEEKAQAKRAVTEATNKKTQAEYDLNTVTKEYESINTQLSDKQAKLDEAKNDLSNMNTLDDGVSAADDAVTEAQQALAAAIEASSISDAKEKLELEKKQKSIADAETRIEELTADSAPKEITSKYDGTVTSVNVAAGDKTEYNSPLASIEVAGKGYTMSLTVTAEQARKLSVGDTAELTNYWAYNDYSIKLVSITSDKDSKGQNKKLTFTVEGEDIIPGQSLSISIGQKSESYDTLVPNSAVREDSNGKFVYVVQVKSSPLGNRYIVKRMDVSVITSDDTYSAISGITSSEFVIVSSTAPLESSMQVRMSED